MPQTSPWGETPEVFEQAGSIRIEPAAIPKLVEALQDSLDRVGVQIEHAITDLRIRPWAGDPVSADVAERFNEHSVGGDKAALTALYGYRDRLQSAAESLWLAHLHYLDTEGTNADRLSSGH